MATVTVTTTSYVDVSDAADPDAVAESIVRDALASQGEIYLVKVERTPVLYER